MVVGVEIRRLYVGGFDVDYVDEGVFDMGYFGVDLVGVYGVYFVVGFGGRLLD